MTTKKRVRLNLSVDGEILNLVKKWSHISGLPISTLFDRVFERETRQFKYESEEAWEASDEYKELDFHLRSSFNSPQILDFQPTSMPHFNFSDEDYESVGMEKNANGDIEISEKYPSNTIKKLEKLSRRQLRGNDYYKRWKEVCGNKNE